MKNKNVYETQASLLKIEPLAGSLWKHYKGGIYKVLMKAVESDEPNNVRVIYQSETLGYIWDHTLEAWNEEIDMGGFKMKRFTPCVEQILDYSNGLEEQWDS
jgi:hypothetical protein